MTATPPHALTAFLEGVRDAGGATPRPVNGRSLLDELGAPPPVSAPEALQRLRTHLQEVVLPPLLQRLDVDVDATARPVEVAGALDEAREAAGVSRSGRWVQDRAGTPDDLWLLVIAIRDCLAISQGASQGFAAYNVGFELCRQQLGGGAGYSYGRGPLRPAVDAMADA